MLGVYGFFFLVVLKVEKYDGAKKIKPFIMCMILMWTKWASILQVIRFNSKILVLNMQQQKLHLLYNLPSTLN